MSLCSVRHQPAAHRLVQRAISRDRVPHAYIFVGPNGVGKETFARGLAQALLCSSPIEAAIDDDDGGQIEGTEGCGACQDCKPLAAGAHPDWHLIHRHLIREHPDPVVRKRKGLDIGVDVLRHFLIAKVGNKPIRGRRKVFVIREADLMTTQAQNALLKTLEEPPGSTLLVLLVSAIDRLLPTTLSRCQVVEFAPLPRNFVAGKLTELRPDLDSASAAFCAAHCEGSIGEALRLADENAPARQAQVAQLLQGLAPGGGAMAAEALIEQAKDISDLEKERDRDISDTEATRRGLHRVMLFVSIALGDALRRQAAASGDPNDPAARDLDTTARLITRVADAERQLDRNANIQLVVESLLFDLTRGLTQQTQHTAAAR